MLKWIEGYSVNIAIIDEQHKLFIDIINEFLEAQAKNEEEEKLSYVLRSLQDYAFLHFETEEMLFKQFNYPDTQEHILAHNIFREKISEFIEKQKSAEGQKEVLEELPKFIKEWLHGHLLTHDMKYMKFFNERGVY
jgi:hemerythrin